MKKNKIFLDFTPLLDVTLIILFFFIMFSSMDVKIAKEDYQNQAEEYSKLKSELEDQIAENESLKNSLLEQREELEKDKGVLAQSNERYAANAEAIMEFRKGHNIKLLLTDFSNSPKLKMIFSSDTIKEIAINEHLSKNLKLALNKAGYDSKDTIFCEFILNGTLPGTAKAYKAVHKALIEIQVQYHFLYTSETDLSIGKE